MINMSETIRIITYGNVNSTNTSEDNSRSLDINRHLQKYSNAYPNYL